MANNPGSGSGPKLNFGGVDMGPPTGAPIQKPQVPLQ